MLDEKDIKTLLSNHKYPCYIREMESERIVYANQEFFDFFHCGEEIYKKKFHELVNVDRTTYQHILESLNLLEDYEFTFFHHQTSHSYTGYATVLSEKEEVFCEFKISADGDFEQAMTRCTEIGEQSSETVLVSYMELVCKYYGCEAAYVYRFGTEDGSISCVAQWSIAPEIQAVEEVRAVMDAKKVMAWIQDKNTPTIMIGDREYHSELLTPVLDEMLDVFLLDNLTMCKVDDVNGNTVGIVGMSNPENRIFFDRRLLSSISRFVAQEVTKESMDATLFQLHQRDLLTGLYNRTGYSRRVNQLREQPPRTLGVLSVNVNGLKSVNDNLGITGGDELIKGSVQQLQDYFAFEFFRMSGDEFIGFAPDVEKEDFEATVTALHNVMQKENNHDFSLGHAWGLGKERLSKLLQEAETIMYINKQRYYHTTERKFDGLRDSILGELLTALEEDEFMIYLQPQVRLKDGSLYGAEALIRRYDKKSEKMIFPDQFISLYEQKSVIRHVDMFVVETVCRLLQRWGQSGKAVPISVNLSRVTLQEFGIVDTIVEICERYQVDHDLLVIEVTERVGLIENNVASSLIQQFKEKGFHISLDDFGCAYSNIVTLAQIEVDEVKIDKSLVDDLTTSKKNHILVKNVLSMCNELEGASTLAEGIEEQNQAMLLHELGCHLGQGYFYSRPIPVEEFERIYIKMP